MRIFCQQQRDEVFVANQSIQRCEKCSSQVKIVELGVYCSYGLEQQKPVIEERKREEQDA